MIWMWCIPSRWHPSLYSVMLYASPSSPVLFNISIANWNLRIIDVNNGFFLYWRKHVDKRLHNSYWIPEINYTHFRYFLYSSPASRNIFLKTIYAQRSKIFIPVGLSAFIKNWEWFRTWKLKKKHLYCLWHYVGHKNYARWWRYHSICVIKQQHRKGF